MSDRPHQTEVYKSVRPPAQGSNVIRVRDSPSRAAAVIAQYDSAELSYFISEVVKLGYVVSFTATSDGGAISVVVYDGFTRFKGYGRNDAHLERSLRELLRVIRGEE